MESCSSQVAVVVDPEFGDQLALLAEQQCVWIADSATNRAVAERLWREKSTYAVTTFRFDPTASCGDIVAGIIPVVDVHHGILSCHPPYNRLAVYGAEPDAAVLAALATVEFALEASIPNGFTAIAVGAV